MKRFIERRSRTVVTVVWCTFLLIGVGCNETPVALEEPVLSALERAAISVETQLNQKAEELEALLDSGMTESGAVAIAGKGGASVIIVRPGDSIQDAVDLATPGSFILIKPGTYREAVTVDKPDLRILGLGGGNHGVVIENPGGEDDGIKVKYAGDGFALANMTVRGFGENGVYLKGVEGFVLFRVHTEDNGEYGLFPVLSSQGLIAQCSAAGHADAGIYVGQSDHVLVRHSTAHGNVIGFEIENSTNIVVNHNESYGNTAGLLAVLLPGLEVKVTSDLFMAHNRIRENNLPNFAEPGELASFVPSGSGLLVLGTDRALLARNRVTGNDFLGIGVGSVCTLAALIGVPCEAFAVDIEPHSDGVEVRRNRAMDNGANPPPIPLPGVDLFWDGTGTDNCWQGNVFGTSFPPELPDCEAAS